LAHGRSPHTSLLGGVKNEFFYATASLAIRWALRLPRGWLIHLGRQLGTLAHLVLWRERRLARSNLALVNPHLDPRQVRALERETFHTLGENLGDAVALLDPRELPSRTLGIDALSRRVLEDALGENRGVVYVTAHLGPWERMAALLAHLGFPISTVARESYDPRFHALIYDRLRRDRNVHAIYRGQPGAPYAIVRALSRGRVVGFPMDLPGRVPVLPVTLLGQPSFLPVGPARIALRTRSPVVVGTPAPSTEGAGLEVRIRRLPADDLDPTPAGEAALTQRIGDALGERIRALPTHWPWMHPSFAGTPATPIAEAPEEPIHLVPREDLV
jgi:Kdo2-lipid IVA lauroyltransferase/acyltransferase